MPQLFQRSFPPVPASVPAARKAVVASLCTHRFGHIADDAAVATSELVTNAVIHAHSRIDVSVDADGTYVRVSTADDSDEPPRPQSVPRVEPGGRGLAIVAAVAHRWGFDARAPLGKVVWFELDAS